MISIHIINAWDYHHCHPHHKLYTTSSSLSPKDWESLQSRRQENVLRMPSSAILGIAYTCPSFPQSSTWFTTNTLLTLMIFIFMTLWPCLGLPPSLLPSQLYTTSSPHLQSRRWEGVFYLVQFTFPCPSSLALGMFPKEQDSSLKVTRVLLFCWTCCHWKHCPLSLASNPNFSLFGLPW